MGDTTRPAAIPRPCSVPQPHVFAQGHALRIERQCEIRDRPPRGAALLHGRIEDAFGAKLDWRRMDDKKASRIVYAQPFDGFNKDAWPEMIAWLSTHIQKLEATLSEPLARLNRQVRNQDEDSP